MIIKDAISQLSIDKKDFEKIFKDITGKKTLPKEIDDKLFSQIKQKAWSSEKVLKWDEFSLWGSDFLSGLWFTQEVEEKPEEIQEEKDDTETEAEIIENKPKDDFPFKSEKIIKTNNNYNKPRESHQKKSKSNVWFSEWKTYVKKEWFKKESFNTNTNNNNFHKKPNNQKPFQKNNKKDYRKPNDFKKARPTPTGTPANKKDKVATTSANLVKKSVIEISENLTVKEFAEKMWVALPELMKTMMKNKILIWMTASIDFDTATLLWEEFGVEVKMEWNKKLDMDSFLSWDLQAVLDLDKEANTLEERAPIVTVMGHVDHGKTTLLDYLRKTSVAWWEAGGITQSIWASVVQHEWKKITFIDTPGHELFTTLRSRWAKMTNVAVIVVASDDSVMPQTIESINHAKNAGVPIIIAITKIDKAGKNLEQIKSDLAANWVTPEEWGWDSPVIWVSGITGQWIPELLETIILHTEMLELKYNPNRSSVGVILDSHKDTKQWVLASMIVMTWTLKVWDIAVSYNTYGKIKRMQDWTGKNIKEAKWWDPVQILWFTELPEAGRMVEIVKNEKEASKKITQIQDIERSQNQWWAMQDFLSNLWDNENIAELRLILKSDWVSSLDALRQAVELVPLWDNVRIKIVHSDVWNFSESDLWLAQASKSMLLGFNIWINASLKKKADNQKVQVKTFDIIYELTEYLEKLTTWMIVIEQEEVLIWKLEVLAIFYSKSKEMVVWGKVIDWKITNQATFRVTRWEDILSDGNLISLQKNKDEVKEVPAWDECGIKVKTGKKIQEWDILEFYEMQDKK